MYCQNCKTNRASVFIYDKFGDQWYMCDLCRFMFEFGQLNPKKTVYLLTNYPRKDDDE